LSGFTISLAPLRERREDIVSLLDKYLEVFNRELGKDANDVAPEALELLLDYPWPGNVRELQNVLKQSLLRSAGPVIIPDFLPKYIRDPEAESSTDLGGRLSDTDLEQFVDERLQRGSTTVYADTLEFMERYLITRVLSACEGNQSKAARMLGITRGCLRGKIRALNVSIDALVHIDGVPCEV
jgi:two-component system nitrogen regulation response regulator GlnG